MWIFERVVYPASALEARGQESHIILQEQLRLPSWPSPEDQRSRG